MLLAELMTSHKEWIVTYHEHDSLLENRPEEDLNEDERERAWEEYEREKEGLHTYSRSAVNYQYQVQNNPSLFATQGVPGGMPMQRSLLPGANLTQAQPRRFVVMTRPAQGSRMVVSSAHNQLTSPRSNLPRVVQEIMKYVSQLLLLSQFSS